ncbi:hypothetical protein RON38_05270 [Lactobacillus mulieris]|uniref:PTS sugar transporter subunit IIA n=2 Tax=Lactobacillus mulieris TaxID=2508708 RepID=UPI001432A5CE|nr:hypothetical protein [Lactobacillus mulieris]MDK6803393.1 hypothetical protein [Lactobacillus mulieris]MDK8382485.1 hypothetical protein [Lactobacillus mulieris]MDT9620904.1 hypothetical protein [Lactobacillus mulieris]NKC41693.1 hypothetical protein [Lactobacillus mulieris]
MDILLISHGPFCNGIKKSLEMISGNMENVTSEEFKPGQNPSDFRNILAKRVEDLYNPEKGLIVMCDLKGGTPYNTILYLVKDYPKLKIITGMNLPLLLTIASSEDIDLPTILNNKLNIGINLIDKKVIEKGSQRHERLSLSKN